jgi:hypothetical protein
MKRLPFLLTLCFLIALNTFSQEIKSQKVPVPVKQAFVKQFPAAAAVKYAENGNNYEISFLIKDKSCIATYNSSGKLIESQTEITSSALPKEVHNAATKSFPGYEMVTIVKREAFDKGICYEMDLKKDDAGYSVRFSDKGEILQKVPRRVQVRVTTK